MKVVVNELEGCRRGLEVEVPEADVSAEIERSVKEYARRARVPGFRQGKIPLDIVRRKFGKEVRDDAIGRVVRDYATRALEEKKLRPIENPILDNVAYEAGRPLTFHATFEVQPLITVTDYHKLAVTVAARTVTDEMVDASLRDLAERAAKLEAVEGRPVQKGDHVIGTLSCRFVKGDGKDLDAQPLFLEAGAERNHPDFNAAMLGMSAGESRSFETSYPEDYAAEALRGRSVAYEMTLNEIKRKVVPEVNDDLAKELGPFAGVAELKEKVRAEIERQAKGAERLEAQDRILAALVERHEFPVPESLVDAQVDRRLEDIARGMIAEGIDPTKAAVNWQEERQKLVPGATRTVRAMLILEAIAAQEAIEATEDDVNQWMREEARRLSTSPGALKEQLGQSARLQGLRRQIVREKTLDFLINGATITREGK